MPEPRRGEQAEDATEDEALEGDALDVAAMGARSDVEGLLRLARAYRSGAAPGGRDMKRCFEAYQAAAALGSGDAEFAVALFHMTGGVVPQDLKEGATRLRAAAERGSVPAKVYLGNLYELGIHYKADPEKADVWYRNAARGARVEAEPGSDAYARELAELGCVRYVLTALESGCAEDVGARLLQRARAHGYGLRLKDEASVEGARAAPEEPAASSPDAAGATEGREDGARPSASALPGGGALPTARARGAAKPDGPSRAAIGLGAFGYALLFEAAGIGAGYAAMLGARELAAHGVLLPWIGPRTELVLPIVLAIVGVVPACLVYRLGTIAKALAIGAALGGIGWVAWGTGQAILHPERSLQALAFGVGGFLAGLLVLGILGGTKREPRRSRRARAN